MQNNVNTEHLKEGENILQTDCEEYFDVFNSNEDFVDFIKRKFKFYKRVVKILFRKKKDKEFRNILYVSYKNVPKELLNAFRCQYPDKKMKVLVPVLPQKQRVQKTSVSFEFFLQNKKHQAVLYKFPITRENIEVYGIYISDFSELDDLTQIKNLNLLAPFVKAIRICSKIFSPDLIHSENIPFFLGSEFESKKAYPIKVVQIVHDFLDYDMTKLEAFWGALNLADKKKHEKNMCG